MTAIIDEECDAEFFTECGFFMILFREMIREVDVMRRYLWKVLLHPSFGIRSVIVFISSSDDMEFFLCFMQPIDTINCILHRWDTREVMRFPKCHKCLCIHIAIREICPVEWGYLFYPLYCEHLSPFMELTESMHDTFRKCLIEIETDTQVFIEEGWHGYYWSFEIWSAVSSIWLMK